MLIAFVLLLGFTQCKKEQTTGPLELENESKLVSITLTSGRSGDNGSRHGINTATGDVTFAENDKIYVGNGGKYIGTITCGSDNKTFSGEISQPVDGTEIYFYFVGGLSATGLTQGSTTSFTVDISDQSSQMPVLSCNHVTYHDGVTNYSCALQNKCSLVKFTTADTDKTVRVGGLYTKAEVNFATGDITPVTTTTGFVTLNSQSATEHWAVLLPQAAITNAEVALDYVGYTVDVPAIASDDFVNSGISISTASNVVYLNWLNTDYTVTDGQTLKGTLVNACKISVADGATVTLDNASIHYYSSAWPGITCLGNATIILADGSTNNVEPGDWDYAGIQAGPTGTTLTIGGTGSLSVVSYELAAAIGGGYLIDCGNIVINGGTINAESGELAAAIGGGTNSHCGNIIINGGVVTALCSDHAPGIGSGCGANYTGQSQGHSASCGDIIINGGTVTAYGFQGAPGIGSGNPWNSGSYNPPTSCGKITIANTVTKVTAISEATRSIGPGDNGATCGTVTIGGTIYWNGSNYQNDGGNYLAQSPLVYEP